MWIYVPTSSRSVPVAEASTSALSWQCQAFARSVTWRGKPLPSPTWSKRFSKVSWLKRLYGLMSEPSTASHGVGSWMASLAASRASHTLSQVGSGAVSTIATSGPRPDASSLRRDRGSSSLKTLAACSRRGLTTSLEQKGYGETYADWVSRLRQDSSARRKSALRMRGSGFSSSAWPTPVANDDNKTPESHLAMKARMPGGPRNTITSLNVLVQTWSTPRSSDGEKGGPNQQFGVGGIPLPAQASQWATPRSTEGGQWQYANRQQTKKTLTLSGQAQVFSLPDQQTSIDGETSSPERRSLNPRFVAWLMGWPPIASTGFGFSATEWCHYRQAMRSALLELGFPNAAPPAQQSLFG